MKRHVSLSLLTLVLWSPCALAQAPNDQARSPECFGGTTRAILKTLKNASSRDAALATLSTGMYRRWPEYICYLTVDPKVKKSLLGNAEQARQDKQPGAPGTSLGSTSLVSKGSSPWLLGFALEHGGLTQSTDGSTVTFRGNVVNSIRALMNSTYLGSYQLGENDPLVTYLSKLSFGISFDTSSSQQSITQGFSPNTGNFSGFYAKYEIYNHRDPRDVQWRPAWNGIVAGLSNSVGIPLADLDKAIESQPGYQVKWESLVVDALRNLPADPTEAQVLQVLEDAAERLRNNYWELPEVRAAVVNVTAGIATQIQKEDEVFALIRRSPLVTVEYNLTRQTNLGTQQVTPTQPSQKLPDLSTVNLVLEKGFAGANSPELTLNASGTWFNTPNTAIPTQGRIRDFRASLQLDLPLKEIQNIGRPTLSFSGQFLALVNEPLGQKVTLNNVTIDRRGNMGVFQTKLSIPIKDSGVKIPISFTYATRTELVKERDVRANIGITFDLDSLFSKAK